MLRVVAFVAVALDDGVKRTVELDREVDGRWIADVSDLPGVLAHRRTRKEAPANVPSRSRSPRPM